MPEFLDWTAVTAYPRQNGLAATLRELMKYVLGSSSRLSKKPSISAYVTRSGLPETLLR